MNIVLENWKKSCKQYAHLIQTIRLYPNLDKVRIAEKNNISSPTLYKALDDLKEKNILNSNSLINPYYGTFVGISIGTSLCKLVFLHFDFTEYSNEEFDPFRKDIINLAKKDYDNLLFNFSENRNYIYFETPDDFGLLKQYLDCIFLSIKTFIENSTLKVLSIGISSTGTINETNQTILQSHNLDFLDNRRLDDLIYSDREDFFFKRNISIHLIQNGTAAVIAEKFKLYENDVNTELRSKKNIVTLYLEYGIGAGFIINDRLFFGSNGYAGEIGHIPIPSTFHNQFSEFINDKKFNTNSKCTCGAVGCVDHYIRSLVFDRNFKHSGSDVIFNYLNDKMHEEETKCLGTILGYITNWLVAVLNVDLVIFTGKLYKSMDVLNKYIEQTRDENSLKFNRSNCKIYKSNIGTLAPAIGAAIYSYYKACNIELDWT